MEKSIHYLIKLIYFSSINDSFLDVHLKQNLSQIIYFIIQATDTSLKAYFTPQ